MRAFLRLINLVEFEASNGKALINLVEFEAPGHAVTHQSGGV